MGCCVEVKNWIWIDAALAKGHDVCLPSSYGTNNGRRD